MLISIYIILKLDIDFDERRKLLYCTYIAMRNEDLRNSFELSGENYVDFYTKILDISNSTYIKKIHSWDLTICILAKRNEELGLIDFQNDIREPSVFRPLSSDVKRRLLSCKLYNEVLQNEYAILIDREVYITSNRFIPTLVSWLGSKMSEPAMKENSAERNVLLSKLMAEKYKQVSLVIRRGEGERSVHKIMAVFSGSYKHVPQTKLLIMVDQIYKMISDYIVKDQIQCFNWKITHIMTEIHLDFIIMGKFLCTNHNVGKIIPGMYLSTSDVGRSSVKVRPYIRIGQTIIYGASCQLAHSDSETVNTGKAFDELMSEVENMLRNYDTLFHRIAICREIKVHKGKFLAEIGDTVVAKLGKKRLDVLCSRLPNIDSIFGFVKATAQICIQLESPLEKYQYLSDKLLETIGGTPTSEYDKNNFVG